MILFVFFLLLFLGTVNSSCNDLPSQVHIYYMTDDPWGWRGDSKYNPDDLMNDYPHFLTITSASVIKQLAFPQIDTVELNNHYGSIPNNYCPDARFVIKIIWDSHIEMIVLGTSPSDISQFDSKPFVNENYYKFVSRYIAKHDNIFKKWYKLHFHKGKWHYYYWRSE